MMRAAVLAVIRGYQNYISPFTPPMCRYIPTCSSYAGEAITRYGTLRGGWLATKRICRCHPWGGHGYDPVPDRENDRSNAHVGDAPAEKIPPFSGS